jgi:hypothetical protein
MPEIYVFNPRANRETLKDFNERLKAFCDENPVIRVKAQVAGPNLVIQMLVADELSTVAPTHGVAAIDPESQAPSTLLPVVFSIDTDAKDLEEQMAGIRDSFLKDFAKSKDAADGVWPMDFDVLVRGDKPEKGWVVMHGINGAVDLEDDAEEGAEEEDGEGDEAVHDAERV